jgi:hypothetical protein
MKKKDFVIRRFKKYDNRSADHRRWSTQKLKKVAQEYDNLLREEGKPKDVWKLDKMIMELEIRGQKPFYKLSFKN